MFYFYFFIVPFTNIYIKLNVLTEIFSLKFTRLPIFFSDSHNGNTKNRPIYRQSSSNSDVLLICKSVRKYDSLKWTWEPRPNSQIDLIAIEKEKEVPLKGQIKPGRHSSTEYNSQALIFHISPVNFNYSGTYRCITETGIYTTIILHTVRGLLKYNVSINKSINHKYKDFFIYI